MLTYFPVQVIQEIQELPLPIHELCSFTGGALAEQVNTLIGNEANTGFDLSMGKMFRVRLVHAIEAEYILLVTIHHIASDGWSLAILMNELTALYSAYSQGLFNPLSSLPIHYSDYAQWQRNWLQGELLEQQLSYWQQQLSDLPMVHNLPLDKPRPTQQSFVDATCENMITQSSYVALNALCRAQSATLFMGLHAVFSTLHKNHE